MSGEWSQWWDAWQLRILILGSLFLQWFLLLATPMRRYTIPRILRACIGLAYVGSNALAIYVLATLFNRHVKAVAGGGQQESALELLRAPILLIHLGGQEELAATSMEDNKQRVSDMVTLVSKASVALYVFYESWPRSSDRRLLTSAILLFVVGILSLCEKPWALKNRAQINGLAAAGEATAAMGGGVTRRRKHHPMWWERLSHIFLFGGHLPPMWWDDNEEAALTDQDKVLIALSDMSLLDAATELVNRRGVQAVEELLDRLTKSARSRSSG